MPHQTIILGAGASRPFGFPLGTTLHAEILSDARALEGYVNSHEHLGLQASSVQNARLIQKHGIVALASYLQSPYIRPHLPSDYDGRNLAEGIVRFGYDLVQSTHESVDRFIGDNPSHQLIGKILLCYKILLNMYDYVDGVFVLKNFSAREIGRRRNWYHRLINHIRDNNIEKVYIVTFNYDLSCEGAFENCYNATEKHCNIDYCEHVTILHVNGLPLKPLRQLHDVGAYMVKSAQQLHLVGEEPIPEVKEMRNQIKQVIAGSDGVYIMGFHFDPQNVEAIGLRRAQKNRCFCLNFDGHRGVQTEARKLVSKDSAIWAGTKENPYYIDEALDKGFLRQ